MVLQIILSRENSDMHKSKEPIRLRSIEEQKKLNDLNDLIEKIWPGGNVNPQKYSGINRDEIKTIIGYAPREMCALLGKSNEYNETYNETYAAEDRQIQCDDITPTSQQSSFLSWLWTTPPTPTKQYSIKADGKEVFVLGITEERRQGFCLDTGTQSKGLRQLAIFWAALRPAESIQSFLIHLNTYIANHASQTPSISREDNMEVRPF